MRQVIRGNWLSNLKYLCLLTHHVRLADRRHDCGAVEHDVGIAWHLTVYEHGQAQHQRDRVGDSSAYQ